MLKKILFGAVVVSQALSGVAMAAPARPQAVSFDSVKSVESAAMPTRIGTSTGRKSQLAGTPFLLPLLGVVALVAVIAVVASGGDDNSSPN